MNDIKLDYINEIINNSDMQHDMEDSIYMLMAVVYGWAEQRGWWTDLTTGEPIQKNVGDTLLLIVTEIAEAYEGHRKNMPDEHLPEFTSLEVELADAMIRILDMAGGMNLRLADAFVAKMKYNCTRRDHSIEARNETHGKKT